MGILVSISIPIFNKRIEKSREITDIANLRSAYSETKALCTVGDFTITDADGNNPKTWTWEGEYKADKDYRDAYIDIYFENKQEYDGKISVYFGKTNGDAVNPHPN